MRRIILTATVLTFLVCPVFAYDFGLTLDSSSTMNFIDGGDQSIRAKAWFLEDTAEAWSFSAQASYVYADDRPYLFDVDELRFITDVPNLLGANSVLSLGIGRYRFSEVSGWVFGHVADGLSIGLSLPAVNVTVSAAYTGLQLKPKSTVIMSRVDVIEDDDDDIVLASPRLVEILDITFPELFALQDLTISAVLQQDLREIIGRDQDVIAEGAPVPIGGGGTINTHYWGVALSGPTIPRFYHSLFFYFETGESLSEIAGIYRYEPILAYLGGVGLRYYGPSTRNRRTALDVLYASGDDDAGLLPEGNMDGNDQTFAPISKRSAMLVFTPRVQNLMVIRLSHSFKLTDDTQTELKTALFFRPVEGAIDAVTDPSSSDAYLGTEVDISLTVRPFSDLGIAISAGVFWPSDVLEGYGDLDGLVRFDASFGL